MGNSAPKKAKTVPCADKVMASVLQDASEIIFIDYVQKGKKINGEYSANLLQRLSDEIKKRPQLAKKKVLFHQDSAPVHTLYSLDLAPSDYFFFTNLKNSSGVEDLPKGQVF